MSQNFAICVGIQNITFCFRQATHAVIFLVMSGSLGSPKVSRSVSTPNDKEGSLSEDAILIIHDELK